MRLPGRLIGKHRLRLFGQPGDQGCGQSTVAHVIERRVVQHEVGMPARSRSRKFSRLFDGRVPNQSLPCEGGGETVVADLRAEAISYLVACASIIDRYPGRCLQSGAQNVAVFGKELIMLLDQQRSTSRLEIDRPTDCNRAVRRGNVDWPW